MAKPKAPEWLREAFRDGVDERWAARLLEDPSPGLAYYTASRDCWLAQHDPARRPCGGPIERFHFIPRQRVEHALGALMPDDGTPQLLRIEEAVYDPATVLSPVGPEFYIFEGGADLILLAAWDPRNGGLGCEHHHRRFDGHACSPRAPKIIVPRSATPGHLAQFVVDYGLEVDFERRFPDQ